MNKEFEELYDKWYKASCFLSTGNFEVPEWKTLVDWSKEHKEDAIDCIIELLKEEPNHIVRLCDELFPDTVTYEGYTPLDFVCNTWLVVLIALKNGQILETINPKEFPDYYKDYNAYQKYMENHYIPWNPFHEDDPNITLEEYKQGKRNDKKLLKERLKEV